MFPRAAHSLPLVVSRGPGLTQDTGARETWGEKPNINIVHYSIVTLYSADWGPGNVPVEDVRGEGENITLYEDLTR